MWSRLVVCLVRLPQKRIKHTHTWSALLTFLKEKKDRVGREDSHKEKEKARETMQETVIEPESVRARVCV